LKGDTDTATHSGDALTEVLSREKYGNRNNILREETSHSRAFEAHLAAAAGQLAARALARDRAGILIDPRTRLGGRNSVQAVWQRVQIGLGCL